MGRAAVAALALGLAALLASCGGGADRTKANVRFVNASDYASLDLKVASVRRFAAVGFGASPGYVEVDPDATDSQITVADASSPLVSLTPSLTRKLHYTVLAWGQQGRLKSTVLDEDATAPDAGKARLRILNAAPDAGALDVYLTGANDTLSAAVPLASAAAVGTLGSFLSVDSGTWRLRLTGAGTSSDLRLDVSGMVLDSKGVYTLVLTPASGGVMAQALLIPQQATVAVQALAHARVRVAAAIGGGGAVQATLGSTTLLAETASPAVGAYVVVPSGEQLLSVTAGGAALASTRINLPAGAERTLLVHSAGGTPQAGWLEDDNRRPSSSTLAKLRLVNAIPSNTASLSMTVDALPLASAVAPGAASGAAELSPGTTLDIAATPAGAATAIFRADDQTLLADGIYTLFIWGGTAPTGTLRKDR